MHRAFRKPLIVASPKSLLRHKSAVSSFDEMAEGSTFKRVIPDVGAATGAAPKKVRKLLFCSGKVYYDLEKERADKGVSDVAIARLEQIAPFPFDLVAAEIARFPNAKVVFAQEEPRNMGFWTYVAPRIATATRVLNGKEVYPVRARADAQTRTRMCTTARRGARLYLTAPSPPPSSAPQPRRHRSRWVVSPPRRPLRGRRKCTRLRSSSSSRTRLRKSLVCVCFAARACATRRLKNVLSFLLHPLL